MVPRDPIGTYAVAVGHGLVSQAVADVVHVLGIGDQAKLKVGSGEHLAAILVSAFLGIPPVAVDTNGGSDLVFEVTTVSAELAENLVGRADVRFADFEVKSLPGSFREFDAKLDRDIEARVDPRQPEFTTTVVSADDVIRNIGSKMIERAREQLARKSTSERSRNVFLVSHFFDYPIVEIKEMPLLAHCLTPLGLEDGVDSVWVLFAPYSLAVWSRATNQWAHLIISVKSRRKAKISILQRIESEFLKQTGKAMKSPYAIDVNYKMRIGKK